MRENRRQYHILDERYVPSSNLWSTFSRLLQRSAEVFALHFSEFLHMREFHQGIFIDIFPLDDVPDGVHLEYQTIYEMQKELWMAIINPDRLVHQLGKGVKYILATDLLVDYINLDKKERMKAFENILVPAPGEYDKVLRQNYGDYHQFVQGGSAHENIILDPDIPYKEYFKVYDEFSC